MPDWSYQTIFKPLLFGLPHPMGRNVALGAMGRLARVPGGTRLIDLMGHMAPPPSLQTSVGDHMLASPFGLGTAVDPSSRALPAFARFGVGWVMVDASGGAGAYDRDDVAAGIVRQTPPPASAAACEEVKARIDELSSLERAPHVFVEVNSSQAEGGALVEDILRQVKALGTECSIVVGPSSVEHLMGMGQPSRSDALKRLRQGVAARLWLACFSNTAHEETLLRTISPHSIDGVAISGHSEGEGVTWGPRVVGEAVGLAQRLRAGLGEQVRLMADPGVSSPRDGLTLLEAGVDLVGISSGLVQTGPGLIKRCNEALFNSRVPLSPELSRPPERTSWFWATVLGFAMLIGAVLAGWVALGPVLLPYDEEFLGVSRQVVEAFNPKIIDFMTHDRITLAGTMVSLGILYVAHGVFGARRGLHWAQRCVVYSALFGFITFFSFMGFGYLDPLHAFVTAVLCQLFLLVVVLPLPPRAPATVLDLDNDSVWKRQQWGQLLFVVQGMGLVLAGAAIVGFGVTSVFVPQDLAFLCMSAEQIAAFGDRLVPLIAHDRATFGGMLIASGLAILLGALWGMRRGAGWQWWTYLLAGLPPYLLTLWIHWRIEYWDQFHLSPVYIGLGLLVFGLVLTRGYLTSGAPARPS